MARTTAAPLPQDNSALSDSEFKALLAGVIPHLRAYGRSLSGNPDLADDLTQDTMVKAWASRDRFERGTSIKAWTFVILRNTFLSQMRRNKFHGDYDEVAVERTLSTPASQEDAGEMTDLQRALMELPQRRPDIDHALIETSGVALPRSVARTVNLVGQRATGGDFLGMGAGQRVTLATVESFGGNHDVEVSGQSRACLKRVEVLAQGRHHAGARAVLLSLG